jgi:hypothetical protein
MIVFAINKDTMNIGTTAYYSKIPNSFKVSLASTAQNST